LTEEERQALKQLKTDKGRVTVVMDKTDYYDKMDALANDKQTYNYSRDFVTNLSLLYDSY